jgi:pilus assembly protein Flp/PilA
MFIKIKGQVLRFLQREDGPTAVEYAVMLALILVTCINAVTAVGGNANNSFTKTGNAARPSGS